MARRYLGVDYGAKRIGLAVADEGLKVARPLSIVTSVDQLKAVIKAEAITDIVLGLPRNLDGDDTPQTKIIRDFAMELEQLGLPLTLQDEAATSLAAHGSGHQRVDDQAAAIILQDYLEQQ